MLECRNTGIQTFNTGVTVLVFYTEEDVVQCLMTLVGILQCRATVVGVVQCLQYLLRSGGAREGAYYTSGGLYVIIKTLIFKS